MRPTATPQRNCGNRNRKPLTSQSARIRSLHDGIETKATTAERRSGAADSPHPDPCHRQARQNPAGLSMHGAQNESVGGTPPTPPLRRGRHASSGPPRHPKPAFAAAESANESHPGFAVCRRCHRTSIDLYCTTASGVRPGAGAVPSALCCARARWVPSTTARSARQGRHAPLLAGFDLARDCFMRRTNAV